jgi:hypothetical protein
MSGETTSGGATGWFSARLAARPGSLAAAATTLAAAGIAIEGIVGSPEGGDGEVQIGVAAAQLDAAIKALNAAGVSTQHDAATPHLEPAGAAGEGLELGIIGAIIRGPRS